MRQRSTQAHSFRDRAAEVAQDVRDLRRAVSELSTELAPSSDLSLGQSEAQRAARLGFATSDVLYCYV